MELTILGTGSAIPVEGRYQTGLLLEDGESRLLVDCGSGVVHRLAETVGVEAVSTVLLTHTHLDHVADIPTLVKARYLGDDLPTTIVGPPGTREVLDHLLAVDDVGDRAAVTVREIEPPAFEVEGLRVRAQETVHSEYCLAYRWGDEFAFSGDSAAAPELVAFADGVDVLAHDCAYPDGHDSEGHATPSDLGRALSGSDIDRVYLTHFYPAAEGQHEAMRATVREQFGGEVYTATDLDRISI